MVAEATFSHMVAKKNFNGRSAYSRGCIIVYFNMRKLQKRDWRTEEPPKGDFRFLGHSDPRGPHDARGILVKKSQFAPWVMHCVCGKKHELPAAPELPAGTVVMVDMIPRDSPLAELNGFEGVILGEPCDTNVGRSCFPIHVKKHRKTFLLPKMWLKPRVFTEIGAMFDGRKEFRSRKDNTTNMLPALHVAPSPPKRVNNKRQAMGLFLRNFRKFAHDGLHAKRYGSLGSAPCKWFPEGGVPLPAVIIWMDTALTTFSIGQIKDGGRDDPYREQWPIQLIRGVVRWKENPRLAEDDQDSLSNAVETHNAISCPSMSSSVGTLSSSSGDGLACVLTLVVVEPTEEEGSWLEHLNPPTPVFLHLRFPSVGIRRYIEACLATIVGFEVEEQQPPPDRFADVSSVGSFTSPPLGKPKEHHKAVIAIKPLIRGFGIRLNWNPYVPLRRFKAIDTDKDGYVSALKLGDCGFEGDLASLGVLLGERLTYLDLSRCDGLHGDIKVLGNCFHLSHLLLPSCSHVHGHLRALIPSSKSVEIVDMSWCVNLVGNLAMLKRPGFSRLQKLNLPGVRPGISGRIETLAGCPLLREIEIEGPRFRGDVAVLTRVTDLEILSFVGAQDIVGDLMVLRKLSKLRICRLNGCRRLTGCVTDIFAAPGISEGQNLSDSNDGGLSSAEASPHLDLEVESKSTMQKQASHPLQGLQEVSLFGCTLIRGDAAVFINLRSLKKLVLYRTKVTLGDHSSVSQDAPNGVDTGNRNLKMKTARHGSGGGKYNISDFRKQLPLQCDVLM